MLAEAYSGSKWAVRILPYLQPAVIDALVTVVQEGYVIVSKEPTYENSLAQQLHILWRLGMVRRAEHNGACYLYTSAVEAERARALLELV